MALAGRQLEAPTVAAAAYGQVVAAAVAVIASLSEQLVVLEVALTQGVLGPPGSRDRAEPARAWAVLGARVLAEFGDDPDRYATAKARKAYAGTAPITRASGLGQLMLARSVDNRRPTTACHRRAFAALSGSSGARATTTPCGPRGHPHHQARRALGHPAGRDPARGAAPSPAVLGEVTCPGTGGAGGAPMPRCQARWDGRARWLD